jgi:hypothetical protein
MSISWVTGVARLSLPSCTSRMTAVAVIALLRLPSRNSEVGWTLSVASSLQTGPGRNRPAAALSGGRPFCQKWR